MQAPALSTGGNRRSQTQGYHYRNEQHKHHAMFCRSPQTVSLNPGVKKYVTFSKCYHIEYHTPNVGRI
eukprot:c6107_g1_i1 orf=2-202(-)